MLGFLNIILVILCLVIGYAAQIYARIKDRNEPGKSSYKDFIPHILEYDVETIIDVFELAILSGAWLNPTDIIKLPLPQIWWIGLLIGFFQPYVWGHLVNAFKIGFNKIGSNNGNNG